MKLTLNVCTLLALISIVLLTGCAGRITPLTAQSLTTLAVYEIAKNNPKITKYMKVVQPEACDIATQQGATLEDVAGAISNASSASVEEKAAINIILSIFQTATASQGSNVVAQAPYLKAVFCDGWAGGLATTPMASKARNAPPKWVLVR